MEAGLIDDFIRTILSVPFVRYHFVHTLLSVPFCPVTDQIYATLYLSFLVFSFCVVCPSKLLTNAIDCMYKSI